MVIQLLRSLTLSLPFLLASICQANPVITEFLADNESGLEDGDGNRSDWIEIFNPTTSPIDLSGWHLSNQTNNLTQWTFPAVTLPPRSFLTVIASGANDPAYFDGTYWHTTFKLAAGGEYLALVAPDGTNVVSDFYPSYPSQVPDISYGYAWQDALSITNLLSDASTAVHIPTNGALSTNWIATNFITNTSWQATSGPGVGFDLDGDSAGTNLVAAWGLDDPNGATTIFDASGGDFNGVARPGLNLGGNGANANTGTSATFNNTSIDVPYDPALNPNDFTFAAWVKPASGGSGHRSVITSRMDDGSNVRGYIIYITPGNSWSFWTGAGGISGSWNALGGPAVVFDQWIHIAISWDSATSTKTMYLDGVVVAQTTSQGYSPNIARDFHIGAGDDNGNSFRWVGEIDEVALWNEAVDTDTLLAHLNDGNDSATAVSFDELIDTDIQTEMYNQVPGAYLRMPFLLNGPAAFDRLTLDLHFDDGFAAYLNGQAVASSNAPPTPAWDDTANFLREDEDALTANVFDLTAQLPLLQTSTNLLAVHGLNRDATEPDFVIRPSLIATSYGNPSLTVGYLSPTTPGGSNPTLTVQPGPAIEMVAHTPTQPLVSETLTVTAEVRPRLHPVTGATLFWRINYGATSSLVMSNTVGNTYTAELSGYAAGDMVRWHIVATDTMAGSSRSPAFLDREGKNQSPEWHGTFVQDPTITSLLPIMYWRTDDVPNSDTRLGARASVFYQGRFYDNMYVRQRGGFTSTGSQKFDFNKADPIYVNEKLGSVGELNLNTRGNDGTFIRQPLAFQIYQAAQVPASESFNVLLVRNGSIQRVAMLIEQVDEDFLDRNDFDDAGAMYKFVQRSNLNPMLNDTITGVEKKVRQHEDFSDIDDFIDAIKNGTLTERQTELFDRIDLPRFTNFMAAKTIVRNVDSVRKNMYMYRDSDGSGEWTVFPWDHDLTLGGGGGGIWANHPYLGDNDHKLACCDQWNVLWDLYNKTPRAQEMFGRRLRSLMDELIGPPGTPANTSFIEQRADQMIALVQPHTGTTSTSIKNWVGTWRNNLYNNFGPGGSEELIPGAQLTQPQITFGSIDFNPIDGQDAEFIELINPSTSNAVDLSNWTLRGGVEFDIVPGTVIPANSRAYVSPNRAAFRARTTGPTGNQGHFVIGNYKGHLNNLGEPLVLSDENDSLISSITYTGQLTEVQAHLVISEIMHNPSSNPDAEYIELLNTSDSLTLDLSNAAFSQGVQFTFPTNTLLAPHQRVLVVKDSSLFATNLNIAGEFEAGSRLDSGGEPIKLEDPSGSTVQEFTFRNTAPWPGGTGLVLIAPYSLPDPGVGYHWRSNAATPGTTDGYIAVTPPPVSINIGDTIFFQPDLLAENVEVILELSSDLANWTAADERVTFLQRDPEGTMHWSYRPTGEVNRLYGRLRSVVH